MLMYGRWVTLFYDDIVECKVFVSCTPSTPAEELRNRAIKIMQNRLPEKKTGISATMEAIENISNYEYENGFGAKFEAEQLLNELASKSE